jgi:hypothetical protein
MDGDRKYGQRGYQENDRFNGNGRRDDKPRPQGPRPPLDVTGPRLPRMVQSVAAPRCWNCSTMLLSGMDFKGKCPKCNSDLHCCKQCSYFEPSTRFQCIKPIPERVNKKDIANECTFFKSRVTVARDTEKSGGRPSGFGSGYGASVPGGANGAGNGIGNGAGNAAGNGSGNGFSANRDPLLGGAPSASSVSSPKSAQDARAAFDSLFKK